jgi:hypothetical protein
MLIMLWNQDIVGLFLDASSKITLRQNGNKLKTLW